MSVRTQPGQTEFTANFGSDVANCEVTRSGGHARTLGDINLQKRRLPALLRDLICRFATSRTVPRTDENVKSLFRELAGDLAPDAFVRSSDQYRFLHHFVT